MGSNSPYVYIFFSVDAKLVINWGRPQPRASGILDKDFYFNYPVKLPSTKMKLTISEGWPRSVMEGKKIEPQPEITVFDETGKPLAGKLVVARIHQMNGDLLPSGYARSKVGYRNKYLIGPVPGVYHKDFMNPLLDEDLYEPLLTNEEGKVKFNELAFSQAGPAGLRL